MTENLLQQVEEKIMTLLTELETARQELNELKHENAILKAEKNLATKKLTLLLEALETTQPPFKVLEGKDELIHI